ncbi:MAG: hypothetical protein M1465_00905 [Candidatus Marsarchaeota archaeon]|nr:hypothetical protein [Candidatus Marsarchaeota archaeon]
MDIKSKRPDEPANMEKARELRFEYAEKAIRELKLEENPKFKIAAEGSLNLINSIKSMVGYSDDLMYEPVTHMHRLNSYTSKLLMSINTLYGMVYTKSTFRIEELEDQYIKNIVDAKGGEIYKKSSYYDECQKAALETDEGKKQKLLHYLRRDLSVLENAYSELEKNHKEYSYALDDGTKSRQVQTLQAIFMMKELSEFGNIDFEKLESWVELKRAYVESTSHEDVDNVAYNLSDLKAFRNYILSLPADQDVDDDIRTEMTLHRREFKG